MKIQKKNRGGGSGVGSGWGGGQVACGQRIEVFVKIEEKKSVGEGGGRCRVWGSGWM